jgi:hypothetical protein
VTLAIADGWTPDDWAALGSVLAGVGALLTFVVALGALVYASRQVDEAVKSRRSQEKIENDRRQAEIEDRQHRDDAEERRRIEQARPFVVVDFEVSPADDSIVDLVIENVGKTLARNVRFAFEPDLVTTGADPDDERRLIRSALLTQGIPSMPPGKRIDVFFDTGRRSPDLPWTFRVRVDCDDYMGRPQDTLEYVLDLGFRLDLERVGVKSIHHVAKALEATHNVLKSWSSAQRAGIAVSVKSMPDDVEH